MHTPTDEAKTGRYKEMLSPMPISNMNESSLKSNISSSILEKGSNYTNFPEIRKKSYNFYPKKKNKKGNSLSSQNYYYIGFP